MRIWGSPVQIHAHHYISQLPSLQRTRFTLSGSEQTRAMASRLASSLSLAIAALVILSPAAAAAAAGEATRAFPPTCTRIECPTYDVLDAGKGYEIRRYNSSAWVSVSAIENISLVAATRLAFLELFNYIQGKNEYCAKIDMTAPVITQVSPSDGPFCASSFVVSFYVPGMYQANPPPAKGLQVQKWGVTYVAVKQFGGFVSDDTIGVEAASLYSSLSGSRWANAVDKGRKENPTTVYTVAQYNSPFEYTDRVNEVWMILGMQDTYAS